MLRFLLAIPLALAVTLGLFTLMAWMVDNGNSGKPEESNAQAFDIVMVEQERDVNRRQRALPEQPKNAPPPTDSVPVANAESKSLALPDMPVLGIDMAGIGVEVGLPVIGEFSANQQAMPLYRVEPRYPSRAMKQGAQGWVKMSFTIDTLGRPVDIKIMDAKPRRLFNKSAVKALRKWKYQPQLEEGKAIMQVNQTVTLEFKLER
ncbi:energy transducer TonB [Moritella marina ATCC 15381]|uniref:Protein TonB n=1 Tax=Moritella marina ATCC 15381 TaxID=1202962 RepID=A0A5J6WGL7_MORMI|nr:energy transducer TonB [Moritella marina]QFI37107.1 energy transducer TonB [Moritella marina ATCC 15381]